MGLSHQKAGIKGLDINYLTKLALSDVNLSNRHILFDREGESAREDTVANVLSNILRIHP